MRVNEDKCLYRFGRAWRKRLGVGNQLSRSIMILQCCLYNLKNRRCMRQVKQKRLGVGVGRSIMILECFVRC